MVGGLGMGHRQGGGLGMGHRRDGGLGMGHRQDLGMGMRLRNVFPTSAALESCSLASWRPSQRVGLFELW